jgi:hypothetical protein
MFNPLTPGANVTHRVFRLRPQYWGACILLLLAASCPGALQFDVFLGYEGVVPEASWFPVVCEIKNDGPAFNGVVEVEPANYNQGQKRRLALELPTGTLKRVVVPAFSATRGNSTWDVRLLDDRGGVRAEQLGITAAKQPASEVPIICALPRAAGGAPVIAPVAVKQTEFQPAIARLQAPVFPDNPLVLEGMDCLYLNSEKAVDLSPGQVSAITDWVNAGGHLVIGVEQAADVNALPWLKELYPCDISGVRTVAAHAELHQWLTSTPWFGAEIASGARAELFNTNPFQDTSEDPAFEANELQVVVGRVRKGEVLARMADGPLMVSASQGWGRVTGLLFSPEREPFRSWKHLPKFWAKLAGVPPGLYGNMDYMQGGGWSTDAVFGAMIDSRQVHKLPVGWLLVLLVVYLVVIGPLDQYWLKRIRRPMLTWITFPCYVALFSGLIYAIGYKLRAGESEWNELHVVDAVGAPERNTLRGRSYLSIYSPSNQRFSLENRRNYATFRMEFAGMRGGSQSRQNAPVLQVGDGFSAQVFVPVWSSQLVVSDWWETGEVPVRVTASSAGGALTVKIENRTARKLSQAQIAIGDRILPLGDLPPNQARTLSLSDGEALGGYVTRFGGMFQQAVSTRQRAFGGSERGQLDDLPNSAKAVSFVSQLNRPRQYQSGFVAPAGLDLSSSLGAGTAVLLAWDPEYAPVQSLCTFSPSRKHKNTLWRVAVPVPVSQDQAAQ